MLLYASLAVTAVLAGLLVYRYDLYDKEPWPLLVLVALAGLGLMRVNGVLQLEALAAIGISWGDHAARAAVAASFEEVERLLAVALLAMLLPRYFNDPMDGLIYGSVLGVGMAIEESRFFLATDGATGLLLPPAELVRLFGHLIMGGVTCFALGMARMRMPRWPRVLAGCLLASMAMHFCWDWLAFSVRGENSMSWWKTIASMGLMFGGMLFYGMLVVVGSDWSRKVFAPHTARQLWGWPASLFLEPKRA